MTAVKRALVVSSVQRYAVLIFNFLFLAVISRLLSPADIGTSVIGLATITVCQTLRDFGLAGYIVNQGAVDRVKVQTAFTISLALSLLLASVLLLSRETIASFYSEPDLSPYLLIGAVQLVAGTFYSPIGALLQRDMKFDQLAAIDVAVALAGGIVSITLGWLGNGAMSLAWSSLIQSIVAGALGFYFLPALWAFKPRIAAWQDMLAFGSFTTLGFVLSRGYDLFTSSLCGRVLTLEALGIYNRANMICDLPLKGALAGVFPVALPALAAEKREGRCLRAAFLNSVALVTAVLWPALLFVALFAQPIVSLIIGPQWHDVPSLVPIIAIASLASFPSFLAYPMLVLAGDVKDTVKAQLISLPICASITAAASLWGLQGIVLSLLVTIPLQNVTTLFFIKRVAHFTVPQLLGAIAKSAFVSAYACALPLLIVLISGFDKAQGLSELCLGIAGAAIGWLVGLRRTGHILGGHIFEIFEKLITRAALYGKVRAIWR